MDFDCYWQIGKNSHRNDLHKDGISINNPQTEGVLRWVDLRWIGTFSRIFKSTQLNTPLCFRGESNWNQSTLRWIQGSTGPSKSPRNPRVLLFRWFENASVCRRVDLSWFGVDLKEHLPSILDVVYLLFFLSTIELCEKSSEWRAFVKRVVFASNQLNSAVKCPFVRKVIWTFFHLGEKSSTQLNSPRRLFRG